MLGGTEPLAQQLLPRLSSLQLMGLPLTRQSSLAPASPASSTFPPGARPGAPGGLPAPRPTLLPLPHTQVLGPLLAPLLRLLVPCLGFLGICSGETPSDQHPTPPQPRCCAGTSRAWRHRAAPAGCQRPGAPLTPQAPTLLGPGAGGRSRRGCSWGWAVTPGQHVLRGGPGCAPRGTFGTGAGGPFAGSQSRGLTPAGQRLCWARGSSSGDGLASGVGRCLFFGVLRRRGPGGPRGGPVTPWGDTLC